MLIRYIGHSTVRLVERFRWDAHNGFVCDVTNPTIARFLIEKQKDDFIEARIVENAKPDSVTRLRAGKTIT
jgi:hypothetical protein